MNPTFLSALRWLSAYEGILRATGTRATADELAAFIDHEFRPACEGLAGEAAPSVDLVAHLDRQRTFSGQTFGPGARVTTITNHIRKELEEIEANPSDLEEWIDVVLLALDGAWRCGKSSIEIAQALSDKWTTVESRKWPDWRTVPDGESIEHIREDDAIRSPLTEVADELIDNEFRPACEPEVIVSNPKPWTVRNSPVNSEHYDLWDKNGIYFGTVFSREVAASIIK